MRIRTRHKLFKFLIILGVLNYLVFLYDVLFNASAWFIYVMIGFIALILLTLILYIGVKPKLEEGDTVAEDVVTAEAEEPEPSLLPEPEPAATPVPPPLPTDVVEVVEIPKPRAEVSGSRMHGPQHYRCPFCSHVFSMEATHLRERRDTRITCPYCANLIRIPARPKVVVGPVPSGFVRETDRAAYECANCGEVLRFSAPASSIRRSLAIQQCSHCGSTRMNRAKVAPA